MSDIIDISLPVHEGMMLWPSDPGIEISPSQRLSAGDGANVTQLTLGTHTGTHVDPPLHFIDGGDGVDLLDLGALIGDALVVDLRGVDGEIEQTDLETVVPQGCERVLFRTTNSDIWRSGMQAFPDRYVSLSLQGARWLAESGVRLVGTDFLSIEQRGAPGHPVHVALLSKKVVIVEGLDLSQVTPGWYRLICLPLRLVDGDGSPARAVLLPRR